MVFIITEEFEDELHMLIVPLVHKCLHNLEVLLVLDLILEVLKFWRQDVHDVVGNWSLIEFLQPQLELRRIFEPPVTHNLLKMFNQSRIITIKFNMANLSTYGFSWSEALLNLSFWFSCASCPS